jgi:hypothetical protein
LKLLKFNTKIKTMGDLDSKIADMLLEKHYIDDIQFVDAIKEQVDTGKQLEEIFLKMGVQKDKIDEIKKSI